MPGVSLRDEAPGFYLSFQIESCLDTSNDFHITNRILKFSDRVYNYNGKRD